MDAEAGDLLAFIPLCTIAATLLVWFIRNKLADETITDAQWKRFQGEIKRLDDRIVLLEEDVQTCHQERDEANARALAAESRANAAEAREAKWKAIAEGIGQNRQEAATLLASERLAEKDGK